MPGSGAVGSAAPGNGVAVAGSGSSSVQGDAENELPAVQERVCVVHARELTIFSHTSLPAYRRLAVAYAAVCAAQAWGGVDAPTLRTHGHSDRLHLSNAACDYTHEDLTQAYDWAPAAGASPSSAASDLDSVPFADATDAAVADVLAALVPAVAQDVVLDLPPRKGSVRLPKGGKRIAAGDPFPLVRPPFCCDYSVEIRPVLFGSARLMLLASAGPILAGSSRLILSGSARSISSG